MMFTKQKSVSSHAQFGPRREGVNHNKSEGAKGTLASCHSKLSVCEESPPPEGEGLCVQWHWQIGLDFDLGVPIQSFDGAIHSLRSHLLPDGLTDGNRDVSDERGQFARCRLHRRNDTKMGTVTIHVVKK